MHRSFLGQVIFAILLHIQNEDQYMKIENLRKMFKNKSKLISLRINPELLELLDKTVEKDREFDSRNELIETLILRYPEQRGSLK